MKTNKGKRGKVRFHSVRSIKNGALGGPARNTDSNITVGFVNDESGCVSKFGGKWPEWRRCHQTRVLRAIHRRYCRESQQKQRELVRLRGTCPLLKGRVPCSEILPLLTLSHPNH